jgi:hypothetical protein
MSCRLSDDGGSSAKHVHNKPSEQASVLYNWSPSPPTSSSKPRPFSFQIQINI